MPCRSLQTTGLFLMVDTTIITTAVGALPAVLSDPVSSCSCAPGVRKDSQHIQSADWAYLLFFSLMQPTSLHGAVNAQFEHAAWRCQ